MRQPIARTVTRRSLEVALWTTAVGALIAAVLGWRAAVPPARRAVVSIAAAAPALREWSADSLAAAARGIAAGDPFRLDRRPASVAFGAEPASAHPAPPPPPKAPPVVLTLAGIVGGPPWAALLDGVPGHSATLVVHAGDVVSGLTVRSVGRDTVIVRGADTTWTLTLKRPWR